MIASTSVSNCPHNHRGHANETEFDLIDLNLLWAELASWTCPQLVEGGAYLPLVLFSPPQPFDPFPERT